MFCYKCIYFVALFTIVYKFWWILWGLLCILLSKDAIFMHEASAITWAVHEPLHEPLHVDNLLMYILICLFSKWVLFICDCDASRNNMLISQLTISLHFREICEIKVRVNGNILSIALVNLLLLFCLIYISCTQSNCYILLFIVLIS